MEKIYFQFPQIPEVTNKDTHYIFHMLVRTHFGKISGLQLNPEEVNGDVVQTSTIPPLYEIPARELKTEFPVAVPVEVFDSIYSTEYPKPQKDRRLLAFLTRSSAMQKARVNIVQTYISNYTVEPSADTEEVLYLQGVTLPTGLTLTDYTPPFKIGVL